MANVDVKSGSKASIPVKAVSAFMGVVVASGGIPVQNVMAASMDDDTGVNVSSTFIFEQDSHDVSAPVVVDDSDDGIIVDQTNGLQTDSNLNPSYSDDIKIESVTPGVPDTSDANDSENDDGIEIEDEVTTSKPHKARRNMATYTITYNVNADDGSALNGNATQLVSTDSGEILNFDTKVTPAAGKKFLGWYDAPTGGNRIYETYKPTRNMTLYAHYTDQNVQQVTFSLGCNYGDTYSFMSGKSSSVTHYRDFDWLKQEDCSGPMAYDDSGNVAWQHNYSVTDDKSAFLVDDMPVPFVPGYEFVGWYTTPQERFTSENINKMKIEQGSSVSSSETIFYARFTKKLTVSFDDLRGGIYDDIVIDSYKSITDSGEKLPVPKIPGATFLGWTMDPDNNSKNWSMPIVTNETMFLNCIEWYGFMCSGCGNVSKHWENNLVYDEPGCDTGFAYVNDDYHVFEETDHFTLYPVYKYHRIDVSFDPQGGCFPFAYDTSHPNYDLVYTDGIDKWGYVHDCIGVYPNGLGSQPYGRAVIPGHESDLGVDQGCWYYGSDNRIPVVERNHYVFNKWVYLDENDNEVDFTYDTILTENMTVYAKWNPGKCFVYYDATDGTITQAERDRVGLNIMSRYSVTTESTIVSDRKQMPIPVSSEGRTFEGWYTEDGERVDENTQILDDTTLYAHWGVLPKDLPVTLRFSAGGGTFSEKDQNGSEVNFKTKTITRSESFGQFPELDDRPGYDFLGWWVVKPNETEPYTENSYLKRVNESTRVETSMISDEDEILIVARWAVIEHVSDMTMTDMNYQSVDRDLNQYRIEYNGKDNKTGLGFTAIVLSQGVRDEFKNVRWSSNRPDIIYVDGEDTIYSPNYFDSFKFGDVLGDVVLTATSLDNPNVKFDIHVNVYKKEVPDPNPPGTGGSGSGSGTVDPIEPDKPPTSGSGEDNNCNHLESLTFSVLNQSVTRGESKIRLDISYAPAHVHDVNFVFTSDNPDVVSVSPDGTWWAYGKAKAGSCNITCVAYEDGVEKLRTVTHIDVYEREGYDPTAPIKPGDTINNPLSPQNPMRTVSFVTNGEPMAPIEVQDGMSVTLPTPVRNGYEFKGWYTGDIKDERAEKIEDLAIYPKRDMVLYAHWEKLPEIKYFTVHFDPCNGMPAVPVRIAKNAYLGSVAFPDVSNPGHVLLGWYDAAVGGNQVSNETQVREDMIIYAHWDQADRKTYTLTLDGNGGMVNKQSGSQVLSTLLTEDTNIWSNISSFVATRDLYTFMGWADAPSGGTMVYDINGHFIEGTRYWRNGVYVGGQNLVVYAQWSRNQKQYTLNFNTREGNYLSPVKYNADTQANHFPTPTRAGYEFLGWFTHPTGGEMIDCIRMNEDKTIFAHWKKIETEEPVKTVTIIVDTGVSPIHIQPYVVDAGTRINLPELTCEGYEFLGWYTEPDAKGTRLLSLVATRDMTIYAGWKEIVKPVPKYQITFDYQDGGTIQVLEREVGEIIEKFPNAIRKGYQFLGWFDQPEGGTRYEAWEDDMTTMFYAQWLKEEDEIPNDRYYTTYFDVMGGKLDQTLYHESISVLEGEIVPLPPATREGYTFDGWYTEPSGGTRVDSLVSSAELTLYAQWTKIKDDGSTYTVMFDHRDSADNNGGTITAMTLSDDEVLDEMPEPEVEKQGEDFKGWYDEPVGGKKFTSYTAKDDITLYARWTSDPTQNPPQFSDSDVPEDAKIYHINFVTGAESEGVTIAPLERKAGQIVTGFPTPYRPGYKFLGWYTQSTNGQAVTGFKVENDRWLYAHWAKIGDTTVIDPDKIDEPKEPTIKPTESGDVLEGTSGDREFFKYVTYKANETSAKISWKGLRDYLATKYNYTVTGYEFSCSGDIKGNTTFGKTTVSCTLTELEADRSYKASLIVKYTNDAGAAGQKTIDIVIPADREGLKGSVNDTVIASSYRLSFDTQVEGLTVADVIYGNGTTVTTFPTISRDGFTFDGWYTEKNGGVRVEKLVLSSDTTLYAHWTTGSGSGDNGSGGSGDSGNNDTTNKTEYTVTFNYQDGTTRTVTERVGTALGTLPTASRAGYTFVGWFTEPAGGMQVTSYQDSKDITFYAHWQVGEDTSKPDKPENPDKPGDTDQKPSGPAEGQHTLTYNTQGGDLIDPVYVNSGTTVDNFPVPVREGYTFLGWYLSPTGGKKLSGVVVKNDVTLYAQWKQGAGDTVTYSIQVSANGGKFADGKSLHTWSENSGAIKDPSEVLAGLNPKRTGYKLLGYSYERTGGEIIKSIAFDKSVKDKMIYAQWQKNTSGTNTDKDDPDDKPGTKPGDDGSVDGTVTDKDLAKYVKFTASATKAKITWSGLAAYLKSEYGYTVKDFKIICSDAEIEDDGAFSKSDTTCELSKLEADRAYKVTFRVRYTDSDGESGSISTEMKIPADRESTSDDKTDDKKNVVTSLELSVHELTVTKGDKINLSYKYSPKGADNAQFVWTSSDSSVISVNDGVFKYVGVGKTTLKISTKDGSISDECEVTVKDKPGTDNSGSNGSNGSNGGSNGSTTPGGSNGSNGSTGTSKPGSNNTGNNGSSGSDGSGDSNKPQQIVDYVLTITSTTGTTTRVTVKSNVTIDALAGKLGHTVASYTLRTATQDERVIDGDTSMYAIAELTEKGEVLLIGLDSSGKPLGSAKVTKTGDGTFTVVMSKDTNVSLKSNSDGSGVDGSGKGNGPGNGTPGDSDDDDGPGNSGTGGEGLRGTDTVDGSPVENKGKSEKAASSVKTGDSNVAPLYGGIFGFFVAMAAGVFAFTRKKRDEDD